MELSPEIKYYMDKSVLCWLATASQDNIPNVSPKEIFTHYKNDQIIIANIASPQTVKNIKENPNVCLSFIEIFVQKGYQLKGKARIIHPTDAEYEAMEASLLVMTKGQFPIKNIIAIIVNKAKPIIAPRYLYYPNTTEKMQIDDAKNYYISKI